MISNIIAAFFYYVFLLPISYLPFRILYGISDGLCWLLFNIVGYRKKDVLIHLHNAFPDKSEVEIQRIAQRFYSHLCDLLVESVKLFTLSTKEAQKRFVCRNPELLDDLAHRGRSIIIAAGHYNNFELAAIVVDTLMEHHCITLYKPLHNRFFDQKIRQSRSRMGGGLVSKPELKYFLDNQLPYQSHPIALLFAMDQSPSDPAKAHWMTFLHQDTGVQFGTEKYAKDYDLAVVYGRIYKEKRGFYSFEFEVINESPRTTPKREITERMTQLLEIDIRRAPEFWLWSHRRWKHKRPVALKSIEI